LDNKSIGGVNLEENYIRLEDIPSSYRDIASIVGVDSFIEICKLFGGNSMYFPTARTILKPVRDENIKRGFNGSNIRELSLKYGICETQIRKILFK
jgi:Mor family transcriptional regulator